MAKFATRARVTVQVPVTITAKGVIRTKTVEPTTVTHEGAPGWERKAKGELFLLAVTNMVGENTFYESGKARDERYVELVRKVAAKNPAWVAGFVPYLRNTLNMRTASIVMAAEYVKSGAPNGRGVVAAALQRAEEPSVLLGYWMQFYGKRIPQPIKRGIADAVQRLYDERSVIKWDSDNLSPRFGDVIELTHAKGQAPWQHDLFKFALDRRHNREDLDRNTESLRTVRAYRALMAMPVAERRPLLDKAAASGDLSAFTGAGLTWENLSGWLQGPMDAKAWEVIIPSMGYMAVLRNLRNFDDAGISPEARAKVIAKLTDPDEVKESRQLPLRFLSAYKNIEGAHWTEPLERALDMTLANIPALSGRTLVLVDVSGSMDSPFSSGGGDRRRASGTAKYPLQWEAAALFGAALAVRAEKADLVAFESGSHVMDFRRGGSILKTVERFSNSHISHGGTNTWQAFNKHYNGHDRVVIVTDEQAHYGSPIKTDKPLYIFNVAGYKQAMAASGNQTYTFGGLTDHAFRAIEQIEALRDEQWPWEQTA